MQVITTVVTPLGEKDDPYTFLVDVEVGGVTVMERTYARAGLRPISADEARDKALEAFGEALRSLIGEI